MTADQFTELCQRRDDLRARHETLCGICNEGYSPFRGEQPGAPSRERDRVWAALDDVETLIQAELDAELAAEA